MASKQQLLLNQLQNERAYLPICYEKVGWVDGLILTAPLT